MPEINPVHILGRRSDAFFSSVPCHDAINGFTESATYTLNFWWHGLEGRGAKKRRSIPDGEAP